jgi:hypothetical protein
MLRSPGFGTLLVDGARLKYNGETERTWYVIENLPFANLDVWSGLGNGAPHLATVGATEAQLRRVHLRQGTRERKGGQ